MIFFRYRKTHDEMNTSFFVENGSGAYFDGFMVGDSVSILLDISDTVAACINESIPERENVKAWSPTGGYKRGAGWHIKIPLVVVDRDHALSFSRFGAMSILTTTTILEAKSGWWEDVLAWLVVGDKPAWAMENM